MKNPEASFTVDGVLGICGGLSAFLGFAPANILRQVSFADVLNEETGEGYQRPYNRQHSLDFRKYIAFPKASTVPLVFNLRSESGDNWSVEPLDSGRARLHLSLSRPSLAQVDCQHRLGELSDLSTSLAFMAFVGLDVRTEMAVFNIINTKARGLSSSLTDYHESSLLDDLASAAPHLYMARQLNEKPDSPWYRLVRYGGETTSGLRRRTSLRMLQKSIDRFLKRTQGQQLGTIQDKCGIVQAYWQAVRRSFPKEWADPRRHLLTKGIGLYSMMLLLGDFVAGQPLDALDERYFFRRLQ
ncbi:MAG: DGQHR domain-containing protein, partial [Spirochaetia bacterium]|nr:DGQHR domain-containing protein [Spirochaetia bacterium]